jgi:putative ATP-binding cassette transporter
VPQSLDRSIFGVDFAQRLWRLTRLYWTSPDAGRAGLLLGLSVALELGTVYVTFVLADAQRRIYDALQDRVAAAFLQGMGIFVGVMAVFVLVSTFRIYVRQALEIRWRSWLTGHLLEQWISPHACCQMELLRAEADNPDQRIAEDARNYVASALGLSLSLLAAVATLVSFAGLLWSLSGDWPLRIGGAELHIPGFMMWVAIAYAALASWITHRVGHRLVPINFDRLRFEADFRFGLVRFRENAEAVGLADGEVRERADALARFVRASADGWKSYLADPAPGNALIKRDNPDMTDDKIAYAVKVMNERGIAKSGDALKLGIGAMTAQRWKSFYDTMAATGTFPTGLDVTKAYSLEFVNKGVGV